MDALKFCGFFVHTTIERTARNIMQKTLPYNGDINYRKLFHSKRLIYFRYKQYALNVFQYKTVCNSIVFVTFLLENYFSFQLISNYGNGRIPRRQNTCLSWLGTYDGLAYTCAINFIFNIPEIRHRRIEMIQLHDVYDKTNVVVQKRIST